MISLANALEWAKEEAILMDNLACDHEPGSYNRDLRIFEAAHLRTLIAAAQDAERWRACLEIGFPYRCYNPERNVTYWYIRNAPGDAETEHLTPAAAIDAALEAKPEGE